MQQDSSTEPSKNLSNVFKINEGQIQDHLGEMVRSTVEETLNAMLDAEADQLCGARRYERSDLRTNGRAGHYKRSFHTKAGDVELKMPKLRYAKFETAIKQTKCEELLFSSFCPSSIWLLPQRESVHKQMKRVQPVAII